MDTSHFSQTLIRGLTDKIYDRRKAAALEIEKLVRENESAPARITEIIDALVQDFVYSNNSNARYGGLIGLAATAIALGPHVAGYLDIIVPPILSCFSNQDQKVRYYACESMYNIAKVAKGEVLRFFNSVFDALCKLSADSENTVKSGAELLDRLIKDVVSELSTTYVSPYQQPLNPLDDTEPGLQQELMTPASLPRNTAFSLPRFIPLLSQRIYVRNSNARQYLVSWIAVLDSIPDLELVSFLPEFLDGLIQCLSDPSVDVRTATKSQLADFLHEIRQASAAAAELRYIKETTAESQRRESLPPPPTNSSLDTTSSKDLPHDQDEQTKLDEHSKLNENAPSMPTTTAKNLVSSENDGQGKGTYIPGQGIVVQYARIVEILVPHLSSPEEDIQRTALEWINEFTKIAQDVIIQFTPEIIKAVLPSLAHHVPVIRRFANATNKSLQKLVLEAPIKTTTSTTTSTIAAKDASVTSSTNATAIATTPSTAASIGPNDVLDPSMPLPPATTSLAAVTQQLNDPQQQYHQYHQQGRRSNITSPTSMTAFNHDHTLSPTDMGVPDPFDYQATLANLRLQFLNEHEETRVASLDWLLMLHKKAPHKILVSDDGTFPALLKTLSDTNEDVVRRDLQLLAQISSYSDHEYFRHFMTNLLSLFSTDRDLLESRGSLIIRELCLSLDSERIYCAIADILETDEDLEFASIMVQNLNIILITAGELSDLRKRLRNLDHKDGQRLFIALYRSWCHNAVATLSLCLLAQAYEHASNMLQVFAELEITVSMLIQIDKLVQLLESPVFTYLRLQLLEPERYPHLFKCLYGILMLLPQSSAFSTLRNRLSSVSSLGFLNVMPKTPTGTESTPKRPSMKTGSKNDDNSTIKFQELLQHFKMVQSRHERQRRQSQLNLSKMNASVRGRRPRLNYGNGSIGSTGSSGQNSMVREDSNSNTTSSHHYTKSNGRGGGSGGISSSGVNDINERSIASSGSGGGGGGSTSGGSGTRGSSSAAAGSVPRIIGTRKNRKA